MKLYTALMVANEIGRTKQTVINWDKDSTKLAKTGRNRLIPPPIWEHGTRYWTEEDLEKIREFAASIHYGTCAEFNRDRWGYRSPQ